MMIAVLRLLSDETHRLRDIVAKTAVFSEDGHFFTALLAGGDRPDDVRFRLFVLAPMS
jgi:hypothetical protein